MKILDWALGLLVLITVLLALGTRARVVCVHSDTNRAEVEMELLYEATLAYERDRNHLPPSLNTLLEPDQTGEPYVRSVPIGPWGQPYALVVEDTSEFHLVCCGEDGVRGSDDDIVWPKGGSH